MLDIKQIRELIEMMVKNDLLEISLRDGEEEVNLRRPNQSLAISEAEMVARSAATVTAQPPPVAMTTTAASEPDEEEDFVEISSPMVGTYYASPDPESAPFVQIGAKVHVGMVVCILEAMKVFNEIKAEVAGTIERTLVNNAQAVEFGQPLFLVRPQ